MAYYKCPDCTYAVESWKMLKGHFMNPRSGHYNEDVAKSFTEGEEKDFAAFEIGEEEYKKLKGKAEPELIVNTGLPKDREKQDTKTGGQKTLPETLPSNPPPEIIEQYTGEPVERLRQVLLVNKVELPKIQTIINIMALMPSLWGDLYRLESMLTAHLGSQRKALVQEIVMQYRDGVQLPQEGKGMYPYNLGSGNQPQSNYFDPRYGPYPPAPVYGPPVVNPEVAALKAEVEHLREERQREHEKQYEDRIHELEKKVETGAQPNPLLEKIKELENRLANARQTPMMVMYDEQGHPMQLPADQGILDAIRRKHEVEMQTMQTEQFLRILTLQGGNTDKLEPILAQMKQDKEDMNKKVEELTKQVRDKEMAELKAELKATRDMATNAGGEGKGILEVGQEAGADIKDGAIAVGKEIKEGFENGLNTIKEILSNKPAVTTPVVSRTPQEISAIMETENELLNLLPGA